jgi:hypothetical protein
MTEISTENTNMENINKLLCENKLLKEEIKLLKDHLASLNSSKTNNIYQQSTSKQHRADVFPKDSELSSDSEVSFIKH